MHVDLGIWDKLSRVVVFLLFVAGLLGVALWYMPLIQKNERYRQRIMKLDEDIQKNREISRQLRASIDALSRDPRAMERLARERLGYARPGETVFRFSEASTNGFLAR
jgi:cell division protein FtsB